MSHKRRGTFYTSLNIRKRELNANDRTYRVVDSVNICYKGVWKPNMCKKKNYFFYKKKNEVIVEWMFLENIALVLLVGLNSNEKLTMLSTFFNFNCLQVSQRGLSHFKRELKLYEF